MDKVTLAKDFGKLEEVTESLLKDFYQKGLEILVKIHFGEPGSSTALFPKDVEPIIEALKRWELKPIFIDTPVAYSSPRKTVKGYEKAARERGWEKLAPFIISDNYKDIKTKDFTAQVCKELIESQNVLVISHIKGHECAGFGGAIKNLGMGGVSKETKGIIHGLCKPIFVEDCQGCGVCSQFCPAKTIKMENGKAKLNNNACWGCSICQIECPYKCLAPIKATFDDLLAQGASAVMSSLPKNTFYINIVKNITRLCDCEKNSKEIIAKDIGVLFSENPVAIDIASVDLIREREKKEPFKEVNHKDPLLHVNFASNYSKFKKEYQLFEF